MVIKLDNRDGLRTELITTNNENEFMYFSELPIFQITVSPDNSDEMIAIDPPGGPYISIGDEIEGKKVTKIFYSEELKHFILTLT